MIASKKILIALSLLVNGMLFAQVAPGSSCNTAGCSTSGSYTNLTGTASMGQYSCLYSTPNPNWLAIGIAQNGSVHLTLNQVNSSGSPIDVDFALYGPYTSVSAGCPIGPSTPTVDCSYSGSATEYIDIASAVVGEVYILLVTNYNGSSGTISITPNSSSPSTGGINCAINFGATMTQTPATCNQANGSATATPVGGYAPYTFSWNSPGNPTTQTISNVLPGTYTVTITSSPNPTTGQTVNPTTANITVTNQNGSYFTTKTPASCATGHDGTATAHYTFSGPPLTATYSWNDPAGQTTQTATGLLPGTYVCTITLSNGCVGTASVTIVNNSVTYTSSTTVVSCPGGSNGTAVANMTPVVGTLSYAWSDPAGQTTQTATGLSAGNYSCVVTSNVGCTGTVNVAVTEIPGMNIVVAGQTDVSCNSGSDGAAAVQVSGGTPSYTYSWSGSSSTQPGAADLNAGVHTVTVTDQLSCVKTMDITIGEPAPLSVASITPSMFLCPEDSTQITAQGAGGSSAYTYTWTENGTLIGVGQTITVDPSTPVTQYCVTLTEQCGSPAANACTTILFPAAVDPLFAPNVPVQCVPGNFDFINNSVNMDSIAEMHVEFGDGSDQVYTGPNGFSHEYLHSGIYDLTVTITSLRGCVTVGHFPGIVQVVDNPVANFKFSSNPTTFYETVVGAQDQSSGDVVSWAWSAPDAVPSTSTVEYPKFTFPTGIVANYPVQLIVVSQQGCIDTVEYTLQVVSDIIFYAPNTFTPDGDEFNQSWGFYVDGIDEFNFELMIFDRWGEIVWETHDVNAKWDGTYHGRVVPAGGYSWIARVKNKYDDTKKEFNGAISVLR